MKFPLSVVIIARNEAINIEACVNAVCWCDEVVVIDDGSTDGTETLAIAAGARVVQHPFVSFADQRNWAMKYAGLTNEWVLHLDADEVVTGDLQTALRGILSTVDPGVSAFRMCRKTMMGNTWLKYSDGFPVWIMRLVRRGHAEFCTRGHGEIAVPDVEGIMGTIEEPFLHFAFSKGLEDWIHRHNRYSSREAALELAEEPVPVSGLLSFDKARRRSSLRNFARRTACRGPLRFFYQYILSLGFLDGMAGLRFCMLMAMYEWWIVEKKSEK